MYKFKNELKNELNIYFVRNVCFFRTWDRKWNTGHI